MPHFNHFANFITDSDTLARRFLSTEKLPNDSNPTIA
jgi:hypothetical protein